jgi:hypothetical protein
MRFALIAIVALLVAVSTPGGEFPVAFTLKAEDQKLTGSSTGPDGSEIQIKDGKIEGANISFTVTFDFGGMPFTVAYKGVLAGEQVKMSADVMGQAMEFVVKKEAVKK